MIEDRDIRYGLFKANSTIGEIRIGIREKLGCDNIKLYTTINGHIRKIADIDTCCTHLYSETCNEIKVLGVKLTKPFIRCIREY